MRIRLNSFAGEFPKVHPSRLADNASQLAQDIMLDAGVLTPITAPQAVLSNLSSSIKQVWAYDVDNIGGGNGQYPWQLFDRFVSVARSPAFDEYKTRYFWSDDTSTQRYLFQTVMPYMTTTTNTTLPPQVFYIDPVTGQTVQEGGSGSSSSTTTVYHPAKNYKVGVPAPIYKPEVKGYSVSGGRVLYILQALSDGSYVAVNENTLPSSLTAYEPTATSSDEARSYVYTYVNEFGEESAPSPPSNVVYCPTQKVSAVVELLIHTGGAVMLANDGYPTIKHIRIYRTNVASNGNAEFQFVSEISIGYWISSLTDTTIPPNYLLYYDVMESSVLSETLPTQGWLPPKVGMTGFGVSNDGFGYGFIGSVACFSEPYALYAWQYKYEIKTRYPIVAMGHYDNVVVIATTGELMLAMGNSPESLNVITPEIGSGCVSKRSMVSTGVSCIYASDDGLMLVAGQSVQNLTGAIMSRKDWQSLNPKSIHGYFYQGKYVFFFDNGSRRAGYVIDIGNVGQGMTQIEQWCVSGFVDRKHNQLYLLTDVSWDGTRQLLLFNPDSFVGYIDGTWRSKVFNMDMPRRMLAGQVLADSYENVELTVVGDGRAIGQYRVKNNKPFRIHNHSVKRDFELVVNTRDVVREVAIGETMRDMLS